MRKKIGTGFVPIFNLEILLGEFFCSDNTVLGHVSHRDIIFIITEQIKGSNLIGAQVIPGNVHLRKGKHYNIQTS